ncbi:hypothetical protein HDU78_005158 [Chytriomyces hyalinus]|nr:hypothetical protein HDU78_005158 [Chytriomyces hyalinus]
MLTVNELRSQSSPISSASAKKRKHLRLPAYVTHEWARQRHSVSELMSCLSEAGVPLALKREKRDYYQDLFDELLLPLIDEGIRSQRRESHFAMREQQLSEDENQDSDNAEENIMHSEAQDDVQGDNHDEVVDTALIHEGGEPPLPAIEPKHLSKKSRLSTSSLATIEQPAFATADASTRKPFKFIRTAPTQHKSPSSRKRRKPPQSPYVYAVSVAFTLLFLFWVAQAAVFYSLWDVAGYRPRGTPAPQLAVTGNRPFDAILTTVVAPGVSRECPKGAVCGKKNVVACVEPHHVLRHSLMGKWIVKWGGSEELLYALPFVPTPVCVYDGAKVQMEVKKQVQVEKLILQLNDIVRIWIGRMSCKEGNPDPEMTELEVSLARDKNTNRWIGLPVPSAKRQLRRFIGEKWSKDKFEEHWLLILNRIAAASAVYDQASNRTVPLYTILDQSSTSPGHRVLVSHDPPILSMRCAFKKNIWSFACTYYPYLFGIATILTSLAYITHRNAARACDSHVTATLVEDILDTLHATHELHISNRAACPVDGVSVAQLRSHFVRTIRDLDGAATAAASSGSPSFFRTRWGGIRYPLNEYGYAADVDVHGRTRWIVADGRMADRLWKSVIASVLRNACVMETVSEVAGGEDCVWQWIGGYALSPKTRKKVDDKHVVGGDDIGNEGSSGGNAGERGRTLHRGIIVENDVQDGEDAEGGGASRKVRYPAL